MSDLVQHGIPALLRLVEMGEIDRERDLLLVEIAASEPPARPVPAKCPALILQAVSLERFASEIFGFSEVGIHEIEVLRVMEVLGVLDVPGVMEWWSIGVME